MVCNSIKRIKARFFKTDFLNYDLLDLYKTTLNELVLNVGDNEFRGYCEALIEFWDELPERMYSID